MKQMIDTKINTNSIKESSYYRHNFLYDIPVVLASIGFFLSGWYEATLALNITVILLFFACIFAEFKEKRYGCFIFYITFFIFLLDTVFFGLFDPGAKYKFLSETIENHVLFCLGLAILGVYVGSIIRTHYKFVISDRQRQRLQNLRKRNYQVSRKMQLFLKWGFMFFGLFNIIEALVKAVFVSSTSYLAYYTEYQAPLPYIMLWLSSAAPILFYFYLGSSPTKKDLILPAIFYLSVGVISLFYGQRNVFVVRTLIVFCYFLLRNKNAEDAEVWITKKQTVAVIIIIPFFIMLMGFWGSFRTGAEYTSKGIWENVRSSLLEQGNNISILDFEYRFRDYLPDKNYALGGIISFLHNNVFGRLIGLEQIPTQMHSADTALNGYNFGAALMYFENRNGFLKGYGIGSCYIAELFYTFGYVGVFIGSCIYGFVLRKLNELRMKSFILNGFALCMFQTMLMAPRANFDGFISGTFQLANLFIALVCWLLSTYVWPEDSNG